MKQSRHTDITSNIQANNWNAAFELLSRSIIPNVAVKKQATRIEVGLTNIAPAAYREMLVDVLGMRGIFKKAIRENIQSETAFSHEEEEVSLFSSEQSYLDWLSATISYSAEANELKLFISPQQKLSKEKVERLIENITKYTDDSVNDSIEIYYDDPALEAASDVSDPAAEEPPQDESSSGEERTEKRSSSTGSQEHAKNKTRVR